MARLASAVKTTMNNSNETMATPLDNLTKTLNTLAAGTSNSANSTQLQSWQAQMDTITNKLDCLMVSPHKEDKIAAYSEPLKEERGIMKLTEELNDKISRMDRRVDARINGIVHRRTGE